MSGTFLARGLTGDWLNGWLAAVGATVLVPQLRVAWTPEPVPTAVFHLGDPGGVGPILADALLDNAGLQQLAIARVHPDAARDLTRKVDLGAFADRAQLARSRDLHPHDRSLEASLTDLVDIEKTGEVAHGPFDPAAPRGTTLFDRLVACRAALDNPTFRGDADLIGIIAASLGGRGRRYQTNGLGFDYRRAASGVYGAAEVHVDPVVECLAFFGLGMFPVRGDGRTARQRGFTAAQSKRGAFRWPCWTEPLDAWAVDAMLDRFYDAIHIRRAEDTAGLRPAGIPARLRRLGITAIFGSVYQDPRGSADTYRAFASERVC